MYCLGRPVASGSFEAPEGVSGGFTFEAQDVRVKDGVLPPGERTGDPSAGGDGMETASAESATPGATGQQTATPDPANQGEF